MRNFQPATQTSVLWMLVASLVISTGCSGIKKSLEGQKQISPSAGTIGIRNMDQLALSMKTVTGVSMSSTLAYNTDGSTTNGDSIDFFNDQIQPWLSTDGNALSVTPPMLLSSVSMAGMFCSALISKESGTLDKLAGTGIKFSQPASAITSDIEKAVVNKFAHLFWRRDPSSDELSYLTASIEEAKAATGSAAVAILVPCTAALGSVSFVSI